MVKLADFGLARFYEGDYYKSSDTSTPLPLRWCAPEVIRFRKFSEASDVWAFGGTMYEITSNGRVPFPDTRNEQLLELLSVGQVPPCSKPPQCDDGMFAVMNECWQAAPSKRPTFIQLCNKLEKLTEPSSQ
jgi:serine/threonine protein kinase